MARNLPYAQYYYALGDHEKALGLAKDGLKYLSGLVEAGAIDNVKDRMAAGLAVYDMIKNRTPLPKDKYIELLTSKIGRNILLPGWAWQLELLGPADFNAPFVDDMESWDDSELPVEWQASEFAAMAVDNDEIVQSSLGDCSVVASLIVMNSKAINPVLGRIYPQDNGKASISSTGYYLVKVTLSGVERVVEISDRRPVTPATHRPLHLTTRWGSAWPFLCEKAYMKIMGGYAFPGSHAAIDTHRMTGWLPKYVDLTAWAAANPGRTLGDLFRQWENQWHAGSVMLCLGTSSDAAPPLAPSHDYAIVDIADGKVKVVNPWNSRAESRWYTWNETFQLFHMLYLNSDPSVWKFVKTAHLVASVSDLSNMNFNLGAHPQYTFHNPSSEPISVEVFAAVMHGPESRLGYLNLQAYLCDHRVYSPQIVELVARSVESNTLYSSLPLTLAPKTSVTVVLHSTQLELGTDTAVFCVQAFSESPVEGHKPRKMPSEVRLEDRWSIESAQSLSDPGLGDNPQFYIDLRVPAKRLDVHYIPCSDQLGSIYSQLAVFYGDGDSNTTLPAPDLTTSLAVNTVYSRGSTSTTLTRVSPGRYVVIPALSQPANGPFYIVATCDVPVRIGKLWPLHSGQFERQFICQGSDVEVRFDVAQVCDIGFQVDSEVEARLCVYDKYATPLAGTEFKRGRLYIRVNVDSGFCKIECKRAAELVLQAFATFPVSMQAADQP